MTRLNLLEVPTDAQSFAEAIATLLAWAPDRETPRYVCTCPVYTLMIAREQPAVLQALRGAAMVTADGMPIVWLQRRLGAPNAERVYGPDIMLALCEAGAAAGVRHALWGGAPGVPESLATALRARIPSVRIVDAYSPPFAPLGDAPDPHTVAHLNAIDADVIWVGLGSPKQDLWAALYRPALRSPLIIVVGAAFDLLSGTKRQAPRWMQRSGTEWLFRLAQEPGRLARRYFVYNPRFVWAAWRAYGRRLRG